MVAVAVDGDGYTFFLRSLPGKNRRQPVTTSDKVVATCHRLSAKIEGRGGYKNFAWSERMQERGNL
jgi:hypothetical protein